MHYKLFVFISIFLITSCGNKKDNFSKKEPAFPVLTTQAQDITGYDDYPAKIQGSNNNEVRAKINGYIEQMYVDEGSFVKKGQALFKLETKQLSQAANASLSGISAAQAAVNAAKLEVEKLIPLVEKNIISNVRLETAKANLLQAQSVHTQAKAFYEAAQANVDYAIIRSPINGVVGKINKRTGSLVGPSDAQPITVVSNIQELYAYFSLNEKDYLDFLQKTPGKNIAEKIKNTAPITLILANGEIYNEKGKLQTVTGQIDPNTGTILFRVAFDNKDGILTNGNSGIIRIPTLYSQVIVIPQTAITEQQGISYVFSVDSKDSTREQIIKIKNKFEQIAIIDTGITQGMRIVSDGAGNLKSGTKIIATPISLDSIINTIKPIF